MHLWGSREDLFGALFSTPGKGRKIAKPECAAGTMHHSGTIIGGKAPKFRSVMKRFGEVRQNAIRSAGEETRQGAAGLQ
jgi:hypothetical protein